MFIKELLGDNLLPEIESPHHGQYDDVTEDGHGVHLLPDVIIIFLCARNLLV